MSLGKSGAPEMASLVRQALSQCPNTKVVLGGWSQGTMVVHVAANQHLDAGQITAAVLFGDEFKGQPVGQLPSDKIKQFCVAGDPVCSNGINPLIHLTYGRCVPAAAEFVVDAAGLSFSSSS